MKTNLNNRNVYAVNDLAILRLKQMNISKVIIADREANDPEIEGK